MGQPPGGCEASPPRGPGTGFPPSFWGSPPRFILTSNEPKTMHCGPSRKRQADDQLMGSRNSRLQEAALQQEFHQQYQIRVAPYIQEASLPYHAQLVKDTCEREGLKGLHTLLTGAQIKFTAVYEGNKERDVQETARCLLDCSSTAFAPETHPYGGKPPNFSGCWFEYNKNFYGEDFTVPMVWRRWPEDEYQNMIFETMEFLRLIFGLRQPVEIPGAEGYYLNWRLEFPNLGNFQVVPLLL